MFYAELKKPNLLWLSSQSHLSMTGLLVVRQTFLIGALFEISYGGFGEVHEVSLLAHDYAYDQMYNTRQSQVWKTRSLCDTRLLPGKLSESSVRE